MNPVSISEVIGAILVLCEGVKALGVNAKYIPLLAMILGIGGAFLVGGTSVVNTLVGILLGLGTTLGYREVKATVV